MVDQDLVTLASLKSLTLNRGNTSALDYDCQTRRINSLLEPEEVKTLMTELERNLNNARAVN